MAPPAMVGRRGTSPRSHQLKNRAVTGTVKIKELAIRLPSCFVQRKYIVVAIVVAPIDK
jgi:hypothetical protein